MRLYPRVLAVCIFSCVTSFFGDQYLSVTEAKLSNSPPIASPDFYTVHASFATPVESPYSGVLKNDSDPDGNIIAAGYVELQTSLGVAHVYSNGVAGFTAQSGASGSVIVPYTVCDTLGACASSTVTFNVVNQPPTAISDTYPVHASFSTPVESPYSGVLKNDSDPDGDSIAAGYVQLQTSLGIAHVYSNGVAAFTAQTGSSGSVAVPYTVCDVLGACSTSTVTFNVANQPPVAVADIYEVRDTFSTPVNSYGVLQNDLDPDGDNISAQFTQVYTPLGVAIIYNNGRAVFSPYAGVVGGTEVIPYTVCDVLGACSQSFAVFHVEPTDRANDAGDSCPIVGAPVNVTNGNMWLEQADYSLPGIGETIEIRRFYNSIIQSSGLFGFGWSTKYDESLWAYGDKLLRLNMPDGQSAYFGRSNTTDPYVNLKPDPDGQILKNPDNSYTLTFKDGRIHRFDAYGKLLWQKDRNGNQTTLNYDASGRLVGVNDPFNRTLTLTPNTNGTIGQISDSMGVVATYEYYPSPSETLLKTVTYADNSKFKFEYTTINNKKYLTTVKDAIDNVLETHAYDSSGRATTSERQDGVERYTLDYSNTAYTAVTDALGRVTKYYFDKSNSRNVVTKSEGVCSCGGGGSEVTEYFYDEKLNLVKKVDALSNETLYTYDSNGNVITQQTKVGLTVLETEQYTYNSFGQVLTYTDAMGGVWTNTYDANGNLKTAKDALNFVTTIEYPTTNNKGLPDSIKDARNNTTKLKWFTASGLLDEIEDPYTKKTKFTYDARGRTKTITNALNHVTQYNYFDDTQRKVEMIYPNSDKITYKYDIRRLLESVTDERGKITNYEFDSAYRLKKITDPLGHVKELGYDLMSNTTSNKDPLGNTTDYKYDDFNRLKEIEYPAAVTGATRLKDKFEYDQLGRIKKVTDTASRDTNYAYDLINRTVTVTNAEAEATQTKYNQRFQTIEVKDALNQVYQFGYDPMGRVLSQTRAGGTMSFEYDEVGNSKKRVDYSGRVTHYTYDNLNRLEKITYGDPVAQGAPPPLQSVYGYDDISRLISATNEAGTVGFTYDNRNRTKSTTDVFGHLLEYEYERTPTVNQKRLKLDGSLYASYNFDDAGRLSNIVNASDSSTTTFGYDNEDKITSRAFPNGVTTTYEYYNNDLLKRLKDVSTTATLFDRQYTYNSANQIATISDLTNTKTFGYDFVDRLKTVHTDGTQTEFFNFDDVGNRTSSHLSSTYGYQAGQFNRLASTATATYGFDQDGNTTTKSEGSNFWRYAWDNENRLVQAWTRKETMRYSYDALGRRVMRHTPGRKENTKFTNDGHDVLLDDDSGTLTKYLNGPGIDNKLRVQTGTNVNYFLTDHLGSANGLADSTGNVTSQTAYDSFGNQTGTLATRYGFTGRERDDFSGLMYYRARFYDANLGRFISEDPIGFSGGDINLFGYVSNQPLFYRDPRGLQPGADVLANPNIWGPIGTAAAAAGAFVPPIAVAAAGAGLIYVASLVGDYTATHPSNPFVNGPWNPWGTPFPGVRPLPPITVSPTSQPYCRPLPRSTPFFPLPPLPPNPPSDEDGGDTCMRLLSLCLENPSQPGRKKNQWGGKQDCGACYRECKANAGAWPFYKCPIFD